MNSDLKFQNVEEAYEAIAQDVMSFLGGRDWDEVVGKYAVYSTVIECRWWLVKDGCVDRKSAGGLNSFGLFNDRACDAVYYLKDNILKSGGDRIWGLTLTVYPNGKFNIEYDYNTPEDYEESDDYEVITGDEINESLRKLFG